MKQMDGASRYMLITVSLFLLASIGNVLFRVDLLKARCCAEVVALLAGKSFLASVGELVCL